mmetsp:Transcript_37740/g.61380  ORF Transcript_37740/g.61380 Transcript_37740/m.61380 type:complete len:115 (+) Transcript_37740:1870-2214(+)
MRSISASVFTTGREKKEEGQGNSEEDAKATTVLSYFRKKFKDFFEDDDGDDVDSYSSTASLGEAGMDSLDLINLRNDIKTLFGKNVTLPLDRFFDRSISIKHLAKELEKKRMRG